MRHQLVVLSTSKSTSKSLDDETRKSWPLGLTRGRQQEEQEEQEQEGGGGGGGGGGERKGGKREREKKRRASNQSATSFHRNET